MKVWWSRTPHPGNFGDVLTPIILNYYGIYCEWTTRSYADAICVGSIVRLARPDMMVLGSGAMSRYDSIEPRARYKWVRGPITADMVRKAGGDCPEIYGDPAMLLPRIFERTIEPNIEVGIFPHYVDLEEASGFIINPLQSVPKVITKLWQCKRIISSSLHGIIVAHAYGIPSAWVKFSNRLDGDDTKFHDHALSVGLDGMPLSTLDNPVFTLPKYDSQAINDIMKGLNGA